MEFLAIGSVVGFLLLLYLVVSGVIWTAKKSRLVFCPNCRKEVDKAARICPFCRSELKSTETPIMTYCAECGKRNWDEEKPCSNCGSVWKKHSQDE